MKKRKTDEEVDLLYVFFIIFNNKLKIVLITLILVAIILGIHYLTRPNFTATTEIKPINNFEENYYYELNTLIDSLNSEKTATLSQFNVQKIDREVLLNLFIEKIRDHEIFIDLMKEFKLLDKDRYETELDYNDALERLATKVQILPPVNLEQKRGLTHRPNWVIKFETKNQLAWENILKNANKLTNLYIKKYLKDKYKKALDVMSKKNNFEIEDLNFAKSAILLNYEIEIKKLENEQNYQIKDIEEQISNANDDHKIKTKNNLAFLYEQAALARKLDIRGNTLEAQTFNSQVGLIANLQSASPYYSRGFEAIEKEIELIESRGDDQAFVEGMLELNQKKRSLEQDMTIQRMKKDKFFLKTILEIDEKILFLENDKTIKRIETSILNTPILKENFKSASMIYINTKFDNTGYSFKSVFFSALIISFLFSILFIIIKISYINKKYKTLSK